MSADREAPDGFQVDLSEVVDLGLGFPDEAARLRDAEIIRRPGVQEWLTAEM